MGAIPRILFSPECEAEIKQRWPSRCPACGCVAYLGLNEYRCVFEPCKYGSKKEADAFAELLEEDTRKHGPHQYPYRESVESAPAHLHVSPARAKLKYD